MAWPCNLSHCYQKLLEILKMAIKLAESDRIDILMTRGYGDRQQPFEEVRTLFNNDCSQRQISKSTVSRTTHRYEIQVKDLTKWTSKNSS